MKNTDSYLLPILQNTEFLGVPIKCSVSDIKKAQTIEGIVP